MSGLDNWSKTDHFPSLALGQRAICFYAPGLVGELLLKFCVEQYGANAVLFIQTAMTSDKDDQSEIDVQTSHFFELASKYKLVNYLSITKEMITKSAVKELTEIDALSRAVRYGLKYFNIEDNPENFEDLNYKDRGPDVTTVILFTALDKESYLEKQARLIIHNHPLGVDGFIRDYPDHPEAINIKDWTAEYKASYFKNIRPVLDITTCQRVVSLAEDCPKYMRHPFLSLEKEELQQLITQEGLA